MIRTRHLIKTFVLSALVGVTLAACGGDGEYAEACKDAGKQPDETCVCFQTVAEGVVAKDPKAKDLAMAFATADKKALGVAAEDYGKLESLAVILALGKGLVEQCNVQ